MSVVARQTPVELQGRYIFAYRNFRTNQVIYSHKRLLLQRDLNAQLPDLGANTRPAEVRPDSWKPFWTVIFPESIAGYHQGLAAYQALRRWRSKREIAYETPPDLARQHTEEEIAKLQKRLDDRGGSKKESVWNLIKRAKRKLRTKVIMDQKATSIADLAHVLGSQYKTGEKRERHRRDILRPAELALLWNNGHNYAENLQNTVEQLEAAQRQLQGIYKAHPDRILNTAPVLELRAKIKQLKARLTTIVFAANIVQQTKAGYAREQGHEVAELPTITVKPYLKQASWKQADIGSVQKIPFEDPLKALPQDLFDKAVIEARLPTFIGTGRHVPPELWAAASKDQQQLMKKQWTSSPSTSGVEIQWEDVLHAEYAEEWPAGVIHRPMGVTKHIANDPEMPPLLTAEDYSERARVRRDLRRLKQIEASDEPVTKRLPKFVRRNEDGLIEHIYREKREELGTERPKSVGSGANAAAQKPRKAILPKHVDAVLREQNQWLLEQQSRRPRVETVHIYDAPTVESAHV